MEQIEKERLTEVLEFAVHYNKIKKETMDEVLSALSDNTLVRPKDIAIKLSCSLTYAKRMLSLGILPKIKIGEHAIGTTRADLNAYINKQRESNHAGDL